MQYRLFMPVLLITYLRSTVTQILARNIIQVIIVFREITVNVC